MRLLYYSSKLIVKKIVDVRRATCYGLRYG